MKEAEEEEEDRIDIFEMHDQPAPHETSKDNLL